MLRKFGRVPGANLLRPASFVLRQFGRVRLLAATLLAVTSLLAGCARAAATGANLPPLPEPALAADTVRIATVAPGVKHRFYWIARGPWAVNVLDVDRSACWTPVALKGAPHAIGRQKTSALVGGYADTARLRGILVAGGVNADFFSFSPRGVPVGAHIHREQALTGSAERPVFAVRRDGSAFVGHLSLTWLATANGRTTALAWNHPQPAAASLLNPLLGERTDTASGALEVLLEEAAVPALAPPLGQIEKSRRTAGVVTAIDTTREGSSVPRRGFVIFVGARADVDARRFAEQLRVGDTVQFTQQIDDVVVTEAVGGFPILLRGDTIVDAVNTAGNAGFRGRNPRTAVGIGSGGRRLLLVTIDGRQAGYSDGTTLAETAQLMKELGASDALNLDGGGSTALVVRDSTGTGVRVANRPSDKEGERPVANALAVEQVCQSRAP